MENQINLALQIIPRTSKNNAYELVDKAIEVIQQSGVKYQVCPFETVMEGEYDQLVKIARDAQDACLKAGAEEVLTFIKIQYRKDRDVTIEEKTGKYQR